VLGSIIAVEFKDVLSSFVCRPLRDISPPSTTSFELTFDAGSAMMFESFEMFEVVRYSAI